MSQSVCVLNYMYTLTASLSIQSHLYFYLVSDALMNLWLYHTHHYTLISISRLYLLGLQSFVQPINMASINLATLHQALCSLQQQANTGPATLPQLFQTPQTPIIGATPLHSYTFNSNGSPSAANQVPIISLPAGNIGNFCFFGSFYHLHHMSS